MLHFQTKPDPIFLAILHDALALRRDELKQFIGASASNEEWEAWSPILATYFSPSVLVDIINRLLGASQDTHVYQPTDYHWLVIYDCLEAFSDVHNDLVAEQPTRMTTVGAFEIGKIDFEALVTLFFWDTDFLASEDLVGLSIEQRKQLGLGPETFGLAAGLAPHPKELLLQPIEGSPNWLDNELNLEGHEIDCYPPNDGDAQ